MTPIANYSRAIFLCSCAAFSMSAAIALPEKPVAMAITHDQFVGMLGKKKIPEFVGMNLKLNLKRGGDGGWDGFIQDPQSMVFFSCPKSSSHFNGGPLTAKVAKIKSNDNGVFVTLDRCE